MPIPSPRGGKSPESKNEFIARCMGDSIMKTDYKDNKQRIAICFSQWERKKETAAYIISTASDEFIYDKNEIEKV